MKEVELDVELVERRVASEWGRMRLFCFDVPWSLSSLLRRAYSATGVSVNCKIYHLSNDTAFPEYVAVCNDDMFNFDVVYEDGVVKLVYAEVASPPSGLYLWGYHRDPRRPPVPDSPRYPLPSVPADFRVWHISFSCDDDYYAVVDIENKTTRGRVPGLRAEFGESAVLYFNEESIGVATKQGFLLPDFRIKYTYEAEVGDCLLVIMPDELEEFYRRLVKKMREDGVSDKDIYAALMQRDDMLLFDDVWEEIS